MLLFCFLFMQFIWKSECVCYFPLEMQGEFLLERIQETRSFPKLNITDSGISIWGLCYSRINDNVILNEIKPSHFISSVPSDNCFRCVNIEMISHSVLKIRATKNFLHECYVKEYTALAACPKLSNSVNKSSETELLLLRSRELDGNMIVQKDYCPLIGKYSFTYKWDNLHNNNNIECYNTNSYVDTCPSGSTLTFYFHQCFYRDQESLSFQCMAHWKSRNKEYLILYNEKNNHFNCSLVRKDKRNELITLSISNETNCESGFYKNDFYLIQMQDPFYKNDKLKYKEFPNWLIGEWEDMIVEKHALLYKDRSSFKTYTIKIVDTLYDDKYLVSAITQCEEEGYTCLRIKNRSSNVIELQISLLQVQNLSLSQNVCSENNFQKNQWIAQSRNELKTKIKCPIQGTFLGQIPDDTKICANLTSNCESNDLMHYNTYLCNDLNEVLEERRYRCLGQWYENELLYTYTERIDLGQHKIFECFVGYKESDTIIHIKEASKHCQRHENLVLSKMQLHKSDDGNCSATFEDSIKPRTTINDINNDILSNTTKLNKNSSANEKIVLRPMLLFAIFYLLMIEN